MMSHNKIYMTNTLKHMSFKIHSYAVQRETDKKIFFIESKMMQNINNVYIKY